MNRHLALLLLPAAVSGCLSTSDDAVATSSAADTTSATPDVVFDGTWGYHGDGARTPGAIANIVYDTSRLPLCRATQDSVAAWAISAFVSADGGPAKPYPLPSGQTGTAVTVPIEVPYASDMAIWFEATDDSGCTQWDSNFGSNFHFTVDEPTRSVIHFEPDFTTNVESAPGNDYALKAGQSIDVDYDFARLPQCRWFGPNDVPAWQITMFYQIDGATPVTGELDQVVGLSFNQSVGVPQPGHIELPTGAETLELWFENDDVEGCNAWDSDYGDNYSFAIH